MIDHSVLENQLLNEKTIHFCHQSGLNVYLTPKNMKTSYAVISIGYGSLHTSFQNCDGKDVKTPEGIAHFLEHKLFEMPDGKDAFEAFASIGANANAYTTPSRTSYLFSCTSNFNRALKILIDMVLTPIFKEESVKREIEIIKQEILSYEDHAPSKLFRELMRNMYEEHNIRHGICGTVETITQINSELLYQCYRSFYNLDNMVLSVSGNVSIEDITNVLDLVFENKTILKKSDVKPLVIHDRKLPFSKHSTIEMSISRPIFQIGIKDVHFSDDLFLMTKRHLLMNIILNEVCGAGSLLYERLQNLGLLQDKLSFDYCDEEGCAYVVLSGETDDPQTAIEEIYKEFNTINQNPPDKIAFEKQKRCVYANFARIFDSTEEIAEESLDNFFTSVHLLSVPDIVFSLQYDDMIAVIQEIFDSNYFTNTIAYPINNKRKE